jgi:hypothetical protein
MRKVLKSEIYTVIAESLAFGTRNHSAKRISEAVQCCIDALRYDGFRVDGNSHCVSKVQDMIAKFSGGD